MTNVLEFPAKNTSSNFPISVEQSIEHIMEVRQHFCDEVSSDILEAAIGVFTSYGLNLKADENTVKHVIFLEEAIKALVYSAKNLNHPFQEIAEEAVTLETDAKKELERIQGKQLNT